MNSALAFKIGQGELTQIVSTALRAEFGEERRAVLRIAEIANSNERAAKNWYRGHNVPDALHLLRLMAGVPRLQAEMRRLAGMESDLDPEFERELSAVMTRFQRLKAPSK